MTKTKKTAKTAKTVKTPKIPKTPVAKAVVKTAVAKTPVTPEPKSSRKAEVIAALKAKDGATIEQLMNLPGRKPWLRHSVRGFICTLGKVMNIQSTLNANGQRTYKLA